MKKDMFFEKETAEYKEIFKDEIDNFREAVDNALKKCVRFEYVSGGLELLEGYYSPNWALEHIVGGIKRGIQRHIPSNTVLMMMAKLFSGTRITRKIIRICCISTLIT